MDVRTRVAHCGDMSKESKPTRAPVPPGERPLDSWMRVSELAEAEFTTRQQVYHAIDQGLPHSRIGARIRVRRADWRRWHESHLVGREAG